MTTCFDIGGSFIRHGELQADGTVAEKGRVATPGSDWQAFVDAIADCAGPDGSPISISLAGAFDTSSGIADVAVEAELRTAEGDSAAARRLWTTYLKALASDGPGPMTEAQARAHLAALEGGAPSSSAEATGSPDAPAGGTAGGGVPVWIWVLLGIPVVAIAFHRMRGGDEQRSTSGS